MGKIVNLSFKVPEEIHKKLKVISALSGKPMSDIIIDFVEKQKVVVPSFGGKPEKVERKKSSNYDAEAIKKKVVELKGQGLSYRQIAERLTEEGFETQRGAGWNKQTLANVYKRAKAAQDA